MPNKTIYVKDESLWNRAKELAGKGGLSALIEKTLRSTIGDCDMTAIDRVQALADKLEKIAYGQPKLIVVAALCYMLADILDPGQVLTHTGDGRLAFTLTELASQIVDKLDKKGN